MSSSLPLSLHIYHKNLSILWAWDSEFKGVHEGREERGKNNEKKNRDMEMCSRPRTSISAWIMMESWTDRQGRGSGGWGQFKIYSDSHLRNRCHGLRDRVCIRVCVRVCVCGPWPCHIDHEHSQLLMTQGQAQPRSQPQSSVGTHTHKHTCSLQTKPPT